MTTTESSNAVTCFICLGNGALRRECSCRADNGFVHLDCLTRFAKDNSMTDSARYKHSVWSTCSLCDQKYQGDLALDLAKAQLEFVEEEHSSRDDIMLGALYVKLSAILSNGGTRHKPQMREDGKRTANKALSLIKKLKSNGGHVNDGLYEQEEGNALLSLGLFCLQDETNAGAEMSIVYNTKARDLYKRIGDQTKVEGLEVAISNAEGQLAGKKDCVSGDQLGSLRDVYSNCKKIHRNGDPTTLQAGMALSIGLGQCHRIIEAEGLLTKLASTSRLAHGTEHTLTKNVEECLAIAKKRVVQKLTGGIPTSHEHEALAGEEGYVYEALEYIDEGAKCIIKGPCNNTETVDSNSIGFDLGTPVACQRLKNAPHLNGKIGDVRSFNAESQRYGVHFEDTSLVPSGGVNVKGENLRIVFDLPEES